MTKNEKDIAQKSKRPGDGLWRQSWGRKRVVYDWKDLWQRSVL